jgi:peptidoglycan/xylan/chitin deacetylase (PgdA/CDA1 family)
VQKEIEFACLTYHSLEANGDQYTVSKKQFRDHLAMMKAEGYVVDGFEQLEGRLRSGADLPIRYVILTIDDGRASSMGAADLLAEHRCQATFFLTRDRSLERPGFLREPEIRELRRRGFSLGTHGTTHRKLTFMSEERCINELKDSKQWLEDVIGEKVCYMAAPGGFINTHIIKLAHEYGYVLTGTCREWMNSTTTVALAGSVNRVNIRRNFSSEVFRCIVEGRPSFYFFRQVRAALFWVPKNVLAG